MRVGLSDARQSMNTNIAGMQWRIVSGPGAGWPSARTPEPGIKRPIPPLLPSCLTYLFNRRRDIPDLHAFMRHTLDVRRAVARALENPN